MAPNNKIYKYILSALSIAFEVTLILIAFTFFGLWLSDILNNSAFIIVAVLLGVVTVFIRMIMIGKK